MALESQTHSMAHTGVQVMLAHSAYLWLNYLIKKATRGSGGHGHDGVLSVIRGLLTSLPG